jgi:hypothetical protein
VDEDGVYWHAELLWTAGIPWKPVAYLSADALAHDIAEFCAWAERVGTWLASKPVADLTSTTALVIAQYGKGWVVPLDTSGEARRKEQVVKRPKRGKKRG